MTMKIDVEIQEDKVLGRSGEKECLILALYMSGRARIYTIDEFELVILHRRFELLLWWQSPWESNIRPARSLVEAIAAALTPLVTAVEDALSSTLIAGSHCIELTADAENASREIHEILNRAFWDDSIEYVEPWAWLSQQADNQMTADTTDAEIEDMPNADVARVRSMGVTLIESIHSFRQEYVRDMRGSGRECGTNMT